MRNGYFNFLLLLLGTAVGLLLLELGIRAAGIAPGVAYIEDGRYRLSENSKLGYEPVPNFDFSGTRNQLGYYTYQGRANSLGFRDRERSIARSPGVPRILILGDSITEGLYVPKLESIFSAQLERRFAEAGTPVEVLNFGVSGYDSTQEVELLATKGIDFHPDIVVVAYCLNDREQNDGNRLLRMLGRVKESRQQGILPVYHGSGMTLDNFALRSHVFRLLQYGLLPRLVTKEKKAASTATDANKVVGAFERLAKLASAHRFQVLVTVFPDYSQLQDYRRQGEHDFVA